MAAPPAAAAGAPPAMVPVAFDGCSGWFHAPAEATASGRGVVLCPPFGQDAVCTGRGWRALSLSAALFVCPAALAQPTDAPRVDEEARRRV